MNAGGSSWSSCRCGVRRTGSRTGFTPRFAPQCCICRSICTRPRAGCSERGRRRGGCPVTPVPGRCGWPTWRGSLPQPGAPLRSGARACGRGRATRFDTRALPAHPRVRCALRKRDARHRMELLRPCQGRVDDAGVGEAREARRRPLRGDVHPGQPRAPRGARARARPRRAGLPRAGPRAVSRPRAERPRRDGSAPADPVRLLSVGRLVEKKGFDDLLESLAMVSPALSWTLDVVGAGPLESRLRRRAIALGLGERVRWRGSLPHDGVVEHFCAADGFALASRISPTGTGTGCRTC